MRLGSSVEIATTRGGTWPERRIIPADGPGWSWQSTKDSVLGRHPSAGEGDLLQANALLDVAVTDDANEWLLQIIG
jgi:hypothetical protein